MQGELGVEPAATAERATLGRRIIYPIKGALLPLPRIPVLTSRPVRTQPAIIIHVHWAGLPVINRRSRSRPARHRRRDRVAPRP